MVLRPLRETGGKTLPRPSDMLDGMKLLLWLAFAVFVFWWLRRLRAPKNRAPVVHTPPRAERMVVCDHCGVNHPVGESLEAAGRHYCCAAHLEARGSAGSVAGEE
jgi:uncharacterized protein